MTYPIPPDPLNDPLEDKKMSSNLHVSPTYSVNICSSNTSKKFSQFSILSLIPWYVFFQDG